MSRSGAQQPSSARQPQAAQHEFDWQLCPRAERIVLDAIEDVLTRLPQAAEFVNRLTRATSIRVIDWADYVVLADTGPAERELASAGFEAEAVGAPPLWRPFAHPGAQLPRVVLAPLEDLEGPASSGPGRPRRSVALQLALKCDAVADVPLANGLCRPIVGPPLGPLCQAALFEADGRDPQSR